MRSKATAQASDTTARVAPPAAIQPSRRRQSSVPANSQPASSAGPQTSAASIFTLKATPSSAIAATSERPRPRSAAAASSRKNTSQESVLLERSTATAMGVTASSRAAISPAATPNGRRTSR